MTDGRIICLMTLVVDHKEMLPFISDCILSALNFLQADEVMVSILNESGDPVILPIDPRVTYFDSPQESGRFMDYRRMMLLTGEDDFVVLMEANDIFLPSAGLLVRDFISEGGIACRGGGLHFVNEMWLSSTYTYEKIASEGKSLLSGFIPSTNLRFLKEQMFGPSGEVMFSFSHSGSLCRVRELLDFYDNIETLRKRLALMDDMEIGDVTTDQVFGSYLQSLKGYGIIPSPYVLERYFY
jgi:hypothetical protein